MSFFSKLFGKGKIDQSVEELLTVALDGIIKNGDFQLSYKLESQGEGVFINLTGEDSNLLTDKDGLVLDGFQTYLKRLLQNKIPDNKTDIIIDCDGYLDSSAQDLKDLADKLKQIALDRGQASFVRALPPRDRKTVHRHLAEDERVKSQSIGEGFYKKIKISPINMKPRRENGEGAYSGGRGGRRHHGGRNDNRRGNRHGQRGQNRHNVNLNDDNRGNVQQPNELPPLEGN